MTNADRGDEFTPTPDEELDKPTPETSTPESDVAVAKAAVESEETPAPEPERDSKGRFIPKARFDEAVNKERERAAASERRAKELEQQLQAINKNADTSKLEAEIQDMEKEYASAMLDGSTEKAAQLMTQIRLKERTIAMAQSESLSAQARTQAAEEIRMETAISNLEDSYDVMNPNHESYDQDVVDMVLGQQQLLISRDRLSPSAALVKAASTVMSKMMPQSRQDEPRAAKGLGAAKARETKAKAVDAALKTPPDLRDVGVDSDKLGMTKGNDTLPTTLDDLKAIPEATLKRMRGDML